MNKKHGVYIERHKKWNTKKIYNHGHLMMTYRKQPKKIHFKSRMLNDVNQNLSYGWVLEGMDVPEVTFEQMEDGAKPFASFGERSQEYADHSAATMRNRGLLVKVFKQKKGAPYLVVAAQDMFVYEIGDLEALTRDYDGIVSEEEIAEYASYPLSDFFDGWDSPPLPLWLTGLILGYPVENTISLYLGS